MVIRCVEQINEHLKDPLHPPKDIGQLDSTRSRRQKGEASDGTRQPRGVAPPYDLRLWTEELEARMKAEE